MGGHPVSPNEKYALAEKAYSEHLSSGECRLASRPRLCPEKLLRDIAYLQYTKQRHVSVR